MIFANVWRGVPFIAISLLAGLQTVPPSLYEAAVLDGATRWQMFRKITYPLLTPIIAVVMTFSVLFTFTDFQLIKVLTNGGPAGATELMATMSYNTAILGGRIGEGAAISTAMVPFLLAAIMVSWFGLQRRKWQSGQRTMTDVARREGGRRHGAAVERAGADYSEGMSYLSTLPQRRGARVHAADADRHRAAVPVLLDDDDGDQAEGAPARPGHAQPVLDAEPDLLAHPRRCCSRPTTRCGCGTRCSSRCRRRSCR